MKRRHTFTLDDELMGRAKGLVAGSKVSLAGLPSAVALPVTITSALSTTVIELNRLYGAYYDATSVGDPKVVEQAWKVYAAYVRRYNDERGLL